MTDTLLPERIKNITQHIFQLPTLPTTGAKLIELIDNPETSATELSQLIASDQVLVAQILKLANSSYYGFPRQINTLPLAIVVLGFDTLKNLGLSISVIDRFSKLSEELSFDFYLFWEHAIACGIASKMIARENKYRVSGEGFVTGLLHDIGKLVVNLYFRKEFEKIFWLMLESNEPMYKVELRVLENVNHADIGAWLAEKWNLPPKLVEGIRYHHNPAKVCQNPQLPAIVHVADYLVKSLGVGFSGDFSTPQYDVQVLDLLQLEKDEQGNINLGYYLQCLTEELEKAQIFFHVISPKEKVLTQKLSQNHKGAC